jgi:hypothetical protein
MLKDFIKNNGVPLHEARLVFKNLLFMSLAEVQGLCKSEDLPEFIRVTVTALLRDYKAGKLDTLNFMLDRIWGKV